MSPHYSRPATIVQRRTNGTLGGVPQDDAMDVAAEALRHAEVEAVQTGDHSPSETSVRLEEMSIDELRKLAAELDVPDRGEIIEQDELIAEIKRRMMGRGTRPK